VLVDEACRAGQEARRVTDAAGLELDLGQDAAEGLVVEGVLAGMRGDVGDQCPGDDPLAACPER